MRWLIYYLRYYCHFVFDFSLCERDWRTRCIRHDMRMRRETKVRGDAEKRAVRCARWQKRQAASAEAMRAPTAATDAFADCRDATDFLFIARLPSR